MSETDMLKRFCANVRRLREENNLTKTMMTEIMGIGVKRLNRIEAGDYPKNLGISSAVRLAQHFNMRVHDLFT
jgi:DNA-binding XRE family transcriptional regulator